MAKAKKGGKAPKLTGEMLVVGSKVRAAIQSAGLRTGGDALDGLNAYIGWLIGQAAKRATENGRQTVRGHDFIVG
jgi:hypothetical protein